MSTNTLSKGAIWRLIKNPFKDPSVDSKKQRITTLQVMLTFIFTIAYVLSNITVMRQIQGPFGLVMAGSTLTYPITYILSDLFSEVYGYRWSRFACTISLLGNLILVVIVQLIMITPAPAGVDVASFNAVFGTTFRIFIASATAYYIGDWVNDIIFQTMKLKHKDSHKGFTMRAILSSAAGSIFDIGLFYIIALIGDLPISVLISFGIVDFCTKMVYEVVCVPFTSKLSKYVKRKDLGAQNHDTEGN